jgi:hypothetical protein
MREILLTAFACSMLIANNGCAPTVHQIASINRGKVNQLYLGMSRDQVEKAMGPPSVTVRRVGPFATTQLTNPHRSEAVHAKDGTTIEVRYYATDVISGPGEDEFSFTEDELTPLVFRDGQLIGWGWNLLFEHVDKSQLQYRYKSNRPDIDS